MTGLDEFPPEPSGWLGDKELAYVRSTLPMLYVDAVPVRLDREGRVTSVGLLLRAVDGAISRALVSGRVMFHETLREALVRHIEKDLGTLAMPVVDDEPQPLTIAQYFPTRGYSPFYDSRQHAVSLAFVVPVEGDCEPRQDALDIVWLTPEEAASEEIGQEMHGGQDLVLRRALEAFGALS